MLNKINLKKQIIITLIFFTLTVTLFSISNFIYLDRIFEWEFVLHYSVISLVISIYIFYVMQKEFNLAFLIFIFGYFFAFAIYLFNTKRSPSEFIQLATKVSWYVIMGLVIASGLSLDYLIQSKKKNAELMKEIKENERIQREKEGENIKEQEKEIVEQNTEDKIN